MRRLTVLSKSTGSTSITMDYASLYNPECRVMLLEYKDWFETTYHFEATNLPEKARATIVEWKNKIEEVCEYY